MAKEDKGKVKMTVIHFETESDNATLQANIHSIAQTLARALAPPTRVIHTPAQLTSGNGANDGAAIEAPEVDDYDDAIDVEATPVAPKKKSGAAPKYTQPKPLELDLASGDMPLRTFLEEKNPEGDIKRYLAIAFWFKQYRETPEITMDHAYTAYRFMGTGWQVPKDAGSPFRAMKKKQYGWIGAGSTRGSYAINHIGENVINQMGGGE